MASKDKSGVSGINQGSSRKNQMPSESGLRGLINGTKVPIKCRKGTIKGFPESGGLEDPLRGFQGYTILGAFEDKSVNLKALKKYL